MESVKYLMALKQIVVLLMVSMMAYSCSLIPKQVDVISKPLERTIAQPVMPREINLSEPYWFVV